MHLCCDDVCQALLQVVKALFPANLGVADFKAISLYAAIDEVVGPHDEDGDPLEASVDFSETGGENRIAARCIKPLDHLVTAVASVEHLPDLLAHKLKVLLLTHLLVQIGVNHLRLESGNLARALQVFGL